jgi:fatty-acyl-CoA synthase
MPAMSPSVPAAWPRHLPTALEIPSTSLWFNLEVAARRYPNKPAYIFFGRELTYDQLRLQAEAIAGWLHKHGVRAGDRVLLQMQNCPQFVAAYYGVLRADAVVVPINPMNKGEEIEHCFRDSGARAVICTIDVVEGVQDVVNAIDAAERPAVVVTRYTDAMPKGHLTEADEPPASFHPWLYADPVWNETWHRWTEVISQALVPPTHTAGPTALAMLPYTSGTTGKPKGCMHPHATLMHSGIATGMWQEMCAESQTLAVVPMFHITGLVTMVLATVYLGATAVVMPRWDRELAGRLITTRRLTHFVCIPTMLIDLLASPNLSTFDLSSLHNLCGGGSAMPEAVAVRLQDQYRATFVEGFGLTETAAMTHMNPLHRTKFQCLGIPVFGNDVRVIDPDTGAELPSGQTGEIVINGPTVFKGYWNQPQATADSFIQLGEQQFFRTGDLGHVDSDGYYFLTDRLKRMINASGFKVWPAEVEALLYRHPEVQEACVVGSPDGYRGETVKAFIVRKTGAHSDFTEHSVMAWAKSQMATYKVPRIVEFVDHLPKSASGKILWRTLQEREGAGARSP